MQGLHQLLLLLVLTCLGRNGCGGEIINGEKVLDDSMKYMVSVQNNKGHVCGGFFVSDQFVLTAKHCEKENLTHVIFGTHDLNNGGDSRYFDYYQKHPYADIMLLELARKVENAETIELPQSAVNLQRNELCQVAGWGKTSTQNTKTDELRRVSVSVIDPQVCKKKMTDLPPKVICAGGYGTKTGFCKGDYGGPLVCRGIAVGVASYYENFNCDNPELPNVYTDIFGCIKWINIVLNKTKH